jgi:hypothetical protein
LQDEGGLRQVELAHDRLHALGLERVGINTIAAGVPGSGASANISTMA